MAGATMVAVEVTQNIALGTKVNFEGNSGSAYISDVLCDINRGMRMGVLFLNLLFRRKDNQI